MNMHERLIDYIGRQLAYPLNPEDVEVIRRIFRPRKLRRHQYFLQQGHVCTEAGFVVSGALKQYSVDESGKENILTLYIEDWWASDRESFNSGTPSNYCIDVVEEAELLVITKEDTVKHLNVRPFTADLMRVLSERQALQLLKRVHATNTMTAEQRLADLEKTYPAFLQRFPQHIIASYLGMTKETLSRIRAAGLKK